MEIASLITYYRTEKGLSVNKLANMAGISQSYLRDVELGKKVPTITTLSYICDALNVSLAEFFSTYCQKESGIDSLMHEIYRLNPKQRKLLEDFLHSLLSDKTKEDISDC
ncbi:MAG: helix-turn-helix domain-containing protein [Lachnospiraceae bacterium]|nr:helix-turn-helix domain-containing protein [Lachnospiraceae bacterium]